MADRFFAAVGDYLARRTARRRATDRLFVVLKGPRRGQPLSAEGVDEIFAGARRRAGLEHGHVSRVAPHLPDPAARSGHGAGGGAGPGRSPLDRVDPDLSASDQRLARRRVSTGGVADRRRPGRGRRTARHPGRWSHDGRGPGAADRPRVAGASRVGCRSRPSAPSLADTMARYLAQAATFLAPRASRPPTTRCGSWRGWLRRPTPRSPRSREIGRDDIEDFKVWLADQPGNHGAGLSANTQRPTAAHAARVLRTDHRVGLARRARPQPGHRRATSHRAPNRSPSSSTTATPPG